MEFYESPYFIILVPCVVIAVLFLFFWLFMKETLYDEALAKQKRDQKLLPSKTDKKKAEKKKSKKKEAQNGNLHESDSESSPRDFRLCDALGSEEEHIVPLPLNVTEAPSSLRERKKKEKKHKGNSEELVPKELENSKSAGKKVEPIPITKQPTPPLDSAGSKKKSGQKKQKNGIDDQDAKSDSLLSTSRKQDPLILHPEIKQESGSGKKKVSAKKQKTDNVMTLVDEPLIRATTYIPLMDNADSSVTEEKREAADLVRHDGFEGLQKTSVKKLKNETDKESVDVKFKDFILVMKNMIFTEEEAMNVVELLKEKSNAMQDILQKASKGDPAVMLHQLQEKDKLLMAAKEEGAVAKEKCKQLSQELMAEKERSNLVMAKMRERVNTLEKEHGVFQNKIHVSYQETQQMKMKFQQLREQMEAEINRLKQENGILRDAVSTSTNQMESKQSSELSKLRQDCSRLVNELTEKSNKLQQEELLKKNAEQAINQLKAQQQEAERRWEEMQSYLRKRTAEHEAAQQDVQNKLVAKDNEIQSLHSKLTDTMVSKQQLEQRMVQLMEAEQKRVTTEDSIQRQVQELMEQNEALKTQLQKFHSQMAVQSSASALAEELHKVIAEKDQQINLSEESLANERLKLTSKEEDLMVVQNINMTLKAEVQKLQALTNNQVVAIRELEWIQKSVQVKDDKIRTLEDQLQGHYSKASDAKEELQDLKDQNKTFQLEIQKLQALLSEQTDVLQVPYGACPAGNSPLQKERCKNGFNCRRRQQNSTACPEGFFCPAGSSSPIPCPEGTFRSAGLSSSLTCLACPVNFFSAKVGQVACLPCGSEAVQPKEGQNTCVCLRQGRVFQPSDAQCPCVPGYRSLQEDRRWDCVQETYDICRDNAVRNQDGQCLTKEEWAHYCSDQVCDIPQDYQGYDKVLGLCLCQVGSLDNTCGLQCRRQQRGVLKFFCEDNRARLSITYRNGRQVDIFWEELTASLQGLIFHAQNLCASETQVPQPVYLIKTNGRGFVGVNDPEPEALQHLFATQSQIPPALQNELWAAESWDISWASAKSGFRFSQPEPANVTPKSTLTGILNPTVCLQMHEILMFIVSKDHYPVYDVNNLYNTNQDFDWGAFRKLAEEMRLASSYTRLFFFLYQFYDPGAYVLRLNSNQHKKMYIRILPFGGQCYEEGPFYPTTPGYVVQVGIAKIADLVLKPDWPAIIGILIALVFLILIYLMLIILCQAFGWANKESSVPQFRKLQLKYNLDKYSSRESKIVIRKYQSGMQARGCLEKNSNLVGRREDQCKLWNSEDLIDLDSFNTNVFFEILLTQSLAVTTKLSQFKEELKSTYFKLLEELASLRDLWVAKMCIPNGGKPCSDALMEDYMKVKEEAEEEIRCRKHRAAEYEEHLNRQINLLTQHLKHEEEHWVAFNSALQGVVRQVEMLDEVLSGEELGSNSKPEHRRLLSLIDAAIEKLINMLVKENHWLTQWGLLGEGTGAGLLNKEKTRVLPKDELVEPGGSLKTEEFLHQDLATGLIMPNKDINMLLANRSMKSASPDHFLHPGTGKLLPIAGNVGFDPIKSKLIPMVDLVSGEIQHRLDLPIFSFVPYPVCPKTGLPGRMNLPVLQPEKVFKFGGLMQDPVTGIEVPILAITAHPQTGQWLTLGGTYQNPLTGMVTPLEIGGPMKAQESGKIVPILGVSLDNNTGIVVPLGGLQGPSGNLLLPGDPFVEPLSGKISRLQGLSLRQDKVEPHAGSYQVLLEANVLIAQTLMVKALHEYKDSIGKDPSSTSTLPKSLDEPEEAMKTARAHKLDYLMYQIQNLEKQQDGASRVKRTGGKLGMIKYLSTEFWMPAVFGVKIPDPGSSELMVPVLGVECDWKTGQPIPLAGVTEDADGKGLVPITIGFKAIDHITGEMGPVIGAQINPWTKTILPVVQSQGCLPRENIDPDLLATLAKELMARRAYWQSQREKEQEIFKEVDHLSRDILDAAKEGKIEKSWFREKLKAADRICCLLESSSAQETQRQAGRDLTASGNPERSLWSRALVDKDEKEQEAKVQLLLRKTLEKLAQFIRKTQLEDQRIEMQLKEAERHWSRNFHTREAIREKFRKTKLHLLTEFQQHVATQQTRVETEYCRLEHLRLLSDIVASQTKDCLSGSSQSFMNYPAARFYSMASTPCGSWDIINKKLIPLLKSVLQTLQENKRGSSSPEEHQESGDVDNSFQDILDLQMVPKSGELVPVLVSSLSAREFVIYQYGIVILQFLRPYIDIPGHQLFVLRESLACVGSFVLLLVHCLAHITAEDFNQDSKPAFRRLFYQALKACLGELFSLKLQESTFSEEGKSAATVIKQALQKSKEASAELFSELLHAKGKACVDPQKDVSGAMEKNQREVLSLEDQWLSQEIERLQ